MHRGERRAKRPNVVWSVFVFLAVSALAGALTAGLALPFAGLAGVTTSAAHDSVQYLPQDLQTAPLAQKLALTFKDRKDQRAYKIGMENRSDLKEDDRIEKTVFVKAPRAAKYGDVVKVIDAIKGAGASPVGLQVDDLP